MQITYELTEKDFTEAHTAHRNSKTWSKWVKRLFVWLAGLFYGCYSFRIPSETELGTGEGPHAVFPPGSDVDWVMR